jgi:lipopolysaccharide exporter
MTTDSQFDQSKPDKRDKDLFAKTVKGGAWVFALRILVQIIFAARYLVFLHFIPITDIGLLGIAMLMIAILNKFTTTGFNAALVQKKDDIKGYLDTAWTTNIIRSVILFTILYFAAPYMAMLKVPSEKIALTTTVIRYVGILIIVNAVSNIGIVYFRKEMQFNKRFIFDITAMLVNVLVSLSIAIIYRSVFALVLGRLAAALTRLCLSYLMHPYRPALKFDLSKAKEMWSFGKWIFAGTIIGFLLTQGDDLFVWGILGPASLAMYQLAYKFSNVPATEITGIIGSVTFPAYSKIQGDIPRLRNAHLKVLQLTAFLSIPTAGLIFILAPDFVHLFAPAEYAPMIRPMQILAIFGMLRSIGSTRGPVFQAVGKLRAVTILQVAKFIIFAILLYPLTINWNIAGTALAIVLVSLAGQPVGFYLTMKVTQSRLWEMLSPMIFPLIATLVMLTVMLGLRHLVFDDITHISIFVFAAAGLLAYIISALLLEKICGYKISTIITEQLQSLRR